jgi:hypothetical protein
MSREQELEKVLTDALPKLRLLATEEARRNSGLRARGMTDLIKLENQLLLKRAEAVLAKVQA